MNAGLALFPKRREVPEELTNRLSIEPSDFNVQRAPQPTVRHPPRPSVPWIRALLWEVQRSDLVLSIFKRHQNRNKRAGHRKGIRQLLLMILWAVIVIVLGFYGGLAFPHHH